MKPKFGVDSFIWAEVFSEKDLWIIPKAKELGFETLDIAIARPETFPTKQVKDEVEKAGIEIVTTTTLTDGVTYAEPPSGEDQKAAFFSEGQLIFTGSGSLIVHGQGDDQHGLGSDDYVAIHSGSIVIQSAVKDGVHTNEGYFQQGGSVEVVTSGSDGVDAGDGPVEQLPCLVVQAQSGER